MCWSMPTFRRNILSPSSRADRWRKNVSPKCRHQPKYQHGAKTQTLKIHGNNRRKNIKSHISNFSFEELAMDGYLQDHIPS
jgi:CYTH domain-containing protein